MKKPEKKSVEYKDTKIKRNYMQERVEIRLVDAIRFASYKGKDPFPLMNNDLTDKVMSQLFSAFSLSLDEMIISGELNNYKLKDSIAVNIEVNIDNNSESDTIKKRNERLIGASSARPFDKEEPFGYDIDSLKEYANTHTTSSQTLQEVNIASSTLEGEGDGDIDGSDEEVLRNDNSTTEEIEMKNKKNDLDELPNEWIDDLSELDDLDDLDDLEEWDDGLDIPEKEDESNKNAF
ncbi:MAG TPA: hypothetical protein ENN12_04295 [Epsilonproteobacteria bacterium]|nr:hypothetical protein [Campylobacterota bacterium]